MYNIRRTATRPGYAPHGISNNRLDLRSQQQMSHNGGDRISETTKRNSIVDNCRALHGTGQDSVQDENKSKNRILFFKSNERLLETGRMVKYHSSVYPNTTCIFFNANLY